MEDMYNNLPRSLKQDLLVSVTVEEDPEVLAQKKELCKARTPKELSTINGLDDFPLPEKIETLVRPGKRNLKRTSDKDSVKRRLVWFILGIFPILLSFIAARAGLSWQPWKVGRTTCQSP